MNPLIAEIQDNQLLILKRNAFLDAKIERIKHLAMTLSEMALKDDNCLQIMEAAAAKMCMEKYKKRIHKLPNIPTSKL
jgi:hypothetical protein